MNHIDSVPGQKRILSTFLSLAKFNYPTNLAIPNAAAAANKPIIVTLNAPFSGGCPVTLLLK